MNQNPSCSCPRPVWFVATYKVGKENYVKGVEVIQVQVGEIPEGNMKRYGKAILIKARDSSQAKMLMNFKSLDTIIDRVTPHKTFNTVKGVIYSKDIHEFSEEEILERCPPNVCQVKKLKGTNHAIILTFSTEYIPDYIRFGTHIKVTVKRYRPKPTQCFNCLDYGHVITQCTNLKRCEKCSEQHQEWNVCELPLHCFHCKGNHSPTSKECLRKKFEQEVVEIAHYQHMSIGSAKRQVLGASKDPSCSYASVVKQMKSVTRESRSTSGVQAEKPVNSRDTNNKNLPSPATLCIDNPLDNGNNNRSRQASPPSESGTPVTQKCKSPSGTIRKERKVESTILKKPNSPKKSERMSEPPVKKRALIISPSSSQELELSNSYSALEAWKMRSYHMQIVSLQ